MRQEHFAAHVAPLDGFDEDSLIERKLSDGVVMVLGTPVGKSIQTIQSYKFPKAAFNTESAAAWMVKRRIKAEFEAAHDTLPDAHNPNPLKSHSLKSNLSGVVRRETLDGRSYIVAPMVMARVGVMNSVMYTEEELSKYVESWNGVPVTYNHPSDVVGNHVPASTPQEWSKYKIGHVFNAVFEGNALKAEAWIDEELAKEKAPQVLANVAAKRPTEVSTGLFVDEAEAIGSYNGKTYTSVAMNYRPNHLAVLPPHEKGAAGWEDGVGLPRTNSLRIDPPKLGAFPLKHKTGGREPMARTKAPDGTEITANAMSHNELHAKLQGALDEWTAKNIKKGEASPSIEAVYDTHCVTNCGGGKLMAHAYSINADGSVTLNGKPSEVRRNVSYDPIEEESDNPAGDGGDDESSGQSEEEDAAMNCDKIKSNKDSEKQPQQEEKKMEKQIETNAEAAPVEQKKPITAEEVLNAIPAEMREMFANGLKIHKADKAAKIERIMANKKFGYTKEQLEAKDVDELTILANAAAPEPAADFGVTAGQRMAVNDEQSAPAMPVIEWTPKSK